MKLNARVIVMACTLAGCQYSDALGPDAHRPQADILDGAHNSGNPRFFFLQPMVPNPNSVGTFDGDVTPTVQICVLTGSACGPSVDDVLATYTMTTGPGSETVRVSTVDQHYIVNWHTDQFTVDATRHYRVRVLVGDIEIGHADLDVVNTGKEVKNVATGQHIPLVNGRTLPIKFRIEQGMVIAIQVTPASAEVVAGATASFTATLTDAHGNVVTSPVSWQSSDEGVATVDDNGTLSALTAGTATVTASYANLSASAQVTVIAPCVAPQPMIGFWAFDEGFGSTTADLSGNGRTGTLQGTPLWISGAQGTGTALDFDDPTDLVNIGSFLSPGVTALTVAAWVNPTSFSNLGDLLAGGVSGPRIISATDGGGWAIGHAPGNGGIQVELRGIATFTLSTTYPVGAWSHIAVVYNGSSVRTYLNGTLVDSRSAPAGTIAQASSCTFIGNEPEGCSRQTNGNFAWQGGIDDVVVFGHALTAEEILAVYERCLRP